MGRRMRSTTALGTIPKETWRGSLALTIYGYARVSTDGQSVAAQEAKLRAAGSPRSMPRKSQARGRAAGSSWPRSSGGSDKGDVLIVTRLDRLARSTRDLLNILHDLGDRGVGFKSLADAWADTTTAHGRLMLTVLAGIAELERELINARTGEGRARAKARGVRFGRPPALDAHQQQEAIQRLAEGAS